MSHNTILSAVDTHIEGLYEFIDVGKLIDRLRNEKAKIKREKMALEEENAIQEKNRHKTLSILARTWVENASLEKIEAISMCNLNEMVADTQLYIFMRNKGFYQNFQEFSDSAFGKDCKYSEGDLRIWAAYVCAIYRKINETYRI